MIERQMIPLYERMGPSAYEVAREIIPRPNASHLDDLSRDEIDQVQRAIPRPVSLANLLRHFLKTYVSGVYLGVVIEFNPLYSWHGCYCD
jgi:hypothetical protein